MDFLGHVLGMNDLSIFRFLCKGEFADYDAIIECVEVFVGLAARPAKPVVFEGSSRISVGSLAG
jgi:hypothetical protein